MYDMWEIFLMILFFGIPVAVIVFFVVSLVKFLRTPKENTEKRKKWKTMLIVSSVFLGLLVVAVLAFIILMMLAIAYM